MNILHITEYFPESGNSEITGGVEARCYNASKYLSKNNKVTVLTSWKKGLKRIEDLGNLKIIRVGPNHKYSNSAGFLSRIMLFFSFLRESKNLMDIEIIDAYNWTSYIPAYIIGKRLDVPVAATYHETWVGEWIKNKGIVTGLPYEVYERLILKFDFSAFISVSEFTKKRLEKHGIEQDKIKVIPNGIDIRALRSIKAKKEEKTVVFLGRLIPTKKVDVLIKAIRHAQKKAPGVSCKIIGQGSELNRLKKLAADLGVSDRVRFSGFIKSHDSAMEEIKSSEIFCNPSILEGFGITLLESMALGVPYVCSDIKPFREVTDNGKGGLLFEQGNYKDLAEKLVILLNDGAMIKKKSEEGKKEAERYDWERISAQILSRYREIIEKNKKDR